jgi:hypothetical protein
MARIPVRDERQGDLFGAQPPQAESARRTSSPPKTVLEVTVASEPASLGKLGARATRLEIGEFLDSLPEEELAYLGVEAIRPMKRRLTRGQGRGLRIKAAGRGKAPLDDALRRIAGELMEFEGPGEE